MRALLRFLLFAAVVATIVACVASTWEPEPLGYGQQIDVSLFYDALSPYGEWYWTAPWGWVWSPRDVPSGWRPYSWGRWVFSDLGWTWVSYWPWGWAPFHYGRWAYASERGWFWVPGSIWGPGWVAWRWGEGWAGWAPLPPEAHWHLGLGLEVDGWLTRLDTAYDSWCFVAAGELLSAELRHDIVPRERNRWLLPLTRHAVRFEALDGRPAERGLPPADVAARLGREIPRMRLADVPAPPGRAERRPQGDRVAVYRPHVKPAPDGRTPHRTRPPGRR
jgi:hypothetical protein